MACADGRGDLEGRSADYVKRAVQPAGVNGPASPSAKGEVSRADYYSPLTIRRS
jgi:hypothetical protein